MRLEVVAAERYAGDDDPCPRLVRAAEASKVDGANGNARRAAVL